MMPGATARLDVSQPNSSIEQWRMVVIVTGYRICDVMILPVTDLRIGQIGHGLGPRATPSYNDSLLTKNSGKCAQA